MERAYNIKRNGKVIKVVGGLKAGRFTTKTTNATTKPKKRTRGRQVAKQRHILAPLIPILWFFLIATGCTGIAEFNSMSQQPLTAEPVKTEIAEASEAGSFESADPPADYVEEDLFDKYFKENAKTMRAICKAESNLNPNAIGDTNTKYISVGLCQIRLLPERGLTKEQMMIPEENVKYSKHLFDKYGFKPWTCYNNNRYLDYLK
jgi:hypothetical protein